MKKVKKIIKKAKSCDCCLISESIPENLFAANTFKEEIEKEHSLSRPLKKSKVNILNEKNTYGTENKHLSTSSSLIEESKRKRLIENYLKRFFKENQGIISYSFIHYLFYIYEMSNNSFIKG